MKYSFSYVEEQDVPVSISVGAYLDCEHYVYLHGKWMSGLQVVGFDPETEIITYSQNWRMGWIRTKVMYEFQYIPPGTMRNFNIRPASWLPSIYNFIGCETRVTFSKHPDRNTTMMHFEADLDLPFWLYPFRGILRKLMTRLHWIKDFEDVEVAKRRAKYFGRDNNSAYLADTQFLLHKDKYIELFG